MKYKIIILGVIICTLILITNKIIKAKEINIKQLKEISYYNPNNLQRYISYQKKNKNLSKKEIIENVNMNLDKTYYTNTLPAIHKDTSIILVNKFYYLNKDYIPNQLKLINKDYSIGNMKLQRDAKVAFENLAEKAKAENLSIIAMSTYRSYSYQENLYNKYVKQDGVELADTYSARPGYSEHQTGLAVDICNGIVPYTDFEKTNEFKWMQENAKDFGFILRFPKGKEQETGYQYESWHYRYVGKKIATEITKNNITLERYIARKKTSQ